MPVPPRRLVAVASLLCLVTLAGMAPAAAATPEELAAAILADGADLTPKAQAATALAEQHPEWHPKFLGFLRASPDGAVRRAILQAMAKRNMPDLHEAVGLGLADGHLPVQIEAAKALPQIGSRPEFAAHLGAALASKDPAVRWLATHAFAKNPAEIERQPAVAKALATDPDPLIRQAFFGFLAPTDAVRAIVAPLIATALVDVDPMTSMAASRAASTSSFAPGKPLGAEQEAAIATLVGRLADADVTVGGAAGCSLLLVWRAEVEAVVREALSAPSLMQRARAADLLRKKKVAFDVTSLADVVAKGSEDEQLYACGTLARVQTAECVPLAVAALGSAHASVRQAAVYALEVMEHPAAEAALVAALGHADANVRYRAAIVLGRRPGSGAAVEPLRKVAAGDADGRVKRAAGIAAACAAGGDLSGVLAKPADIAAAAANAAPRRFDVAAGKPTVVENGVAQVGGQKQLLVDDLVVEKLGGATRQVHSFRKDARNPVLEQQFPWEPMGTLNFCTTVRYDPETKLFSFWYTSTKFITDTGEAISNRAQCLAQSVDGIEWVRPALTVRPFEQSQATNLVGRAASIVKLPDEADPARAYASFQWLPKTNGLSVSFSPDGRDGWTEPKFVTGGGKDVCTVGRDDLSPGFFSFMKWRIGYWNRRAAWSAWGDKPESIRRGLINVTAGFADDRGSAARVAAAFPGLDFYRPELMRTEVYEIVPFVYEGIYFGFPIRFDISGPGGANVDGPTDLCLMFCRDKKGAGGWLRPGTPGYLEAASGTAESEQVERIVSPLVGVLDWGRWGEWDATQHYGPSSVLVIDDEIVLYYTGASYGHEPEGSKSDGAGKNVYRAAIGRATLRLDGMVSLRAGAEPAEIVTKPLVFAGSELVVNAACSRGKLTVEVLDADGKPLPGYGAAEADAFTGDAVRHVVSWRGKADVATLAGTPVRLRFRLSDGDLYSFQFRNHQELR